MKTPSQLIEELDELQREIWTHIDDPENLSRDILKLAVLNVGLGNHLIAALEEDRLTETNLKYSREKIKAARINDGETAAKAESYKIIDTKELWDDYNRAANAAMVLKTKRSDTEQVIDAARSRLALIRQDLRQTT